MDTTLNGVLETHMVCVLFVYARLFVLHPLGLSDERTTPCWIVFVVVEGEFVNLFYYKSARLVGNLKQSALNSQP